MGILGSTSKARPGNVTLSWGRSGGINCHRGCRWLGNGCYGERVESRPDRQALAKKLDRLEKMRPEVVTYAALAELEQLTWDGVYVPWFRLANAGSVPPASRWEDKGAALTLLGDWIRRKGWEGKTHVPVEEPNQRRWLQRILGPGIAVRLSVQTTTGRLDQEGPVSYVAGEKGQTPRERLQAARVLKRRREATSGRRTVVCPETAWKIARRGQPKPSAVKCGEGGCTACARCDVDVVYPLTM